MLAQAPPIPELTNWYEVAGFCVFAVCSVVLQIYTMWITSSKGNATTAAAISAAKSAREATTAAMTAVDIGKLNASAVANVHSAISGNTIEARQKIVNMEEKLHGIDEVLKNLRSVVDAREK